MKKSLWVLALMFTLVGMAMAQEKNPDTTKVYGGFTSISAPGDSSQGINAQAQVKIVRFGEVKLEAAGDYAVYFPGFGTDIHTFQGGPQLGVDLFDRKLTAFGRALFGALTTFNGDATYSYLVGGGLDVNVSKRVFLRGGVDRQYVRDAGMSFNRLTVGGGFRF